MYVSNTGDFCVSPFSLSVDLSMLASGAKGNTFKQIAEVLGFQNISVNQLNSYYKETISSVSSENDARVDIANSVWVNNGYSIYSSYLENLSLNYNAETYYLDLWASNAPGIINKWCADKTSNRITKVINDIPATNMILINTLYFKSLWAHAFERTSISSFRHSNGQKEDIGMMLRAGTYSLAQTDKVQMLEIPYKYKDFVMDIILPKNELDVFVSDFSLEDWNNTVAALNSTFVDVMLPYFRIETSVDMKPLLMRLGITDAFSQGIADFTGIGKPSLSVGRVIQKTWIDVNTNGTEAAAVTVIDTETASGEENKPLSFHADHSFVYLIRQLSTDTILFIGIKD